MSALLRRRARVRARQAEPTRWTRRWSMQPTFQPAPQAASSPAVYAGLVTTVQMLQGGSPMLVVPTAAQPATLPSPSAAQPLDCEALWQGVEARNGQAD